MNYENANPTEPLALSAGARLRRVGIFREVLEMAIVPIWFPVEGFPNYEVSDTDLIRNKKTKKLLKQCLDDNGYRIVGLSKDGKAHTKRVHRIIAIARLPNPENKPCVNHINGIKTDNRDNLEWVTYQENALHAYRTGLASNAAATAAATKAQLAKTHCKRGHLFTERKNGWRYCRICDSALQKINRIRNGKSPPM